MSLEGGDIPAHAPLRQNSCAGRFALNRKGAKDAKVNPKTLRALRAFAVHSLGWGDLQCS